MSSAPDRSLTPYVAVAGAVLTVIVGAIGGVAPAVGALAGAVLATANFAGIRWLTARMLTGSTTSRRSAAVMLGLKMALVLAIVWFLLARLELHAIGFAVGVSALFVGFGLGSARLVETAASTGGEG
jgi:hypothetical protein